MKIPTIFVFTAWICGLIALGTIIVLRKMDNSIIVAESKMPLPTDVYTPTLEPTPTDILITKENVMHEVNEWRISEGMTPYKESEFLCKAAEERLPEVKLNWSHKGFSAKRFCGESECWLGENLAKEYSSPHETLINWLNSPSHRRELEKPYTHSCIATDGDYVVQIFGYW